jgi:arsenate reductase-like glutaredoxin family protein
MIESFDIDSITSYLKNSIPVTSLVVNPEYQALDREHKKVLSLLKKNKMKYAEITLKDKEMSEKEMERFVKKKTDKKTEIEDLEKEKIEIIQKKKKTKKKIPFSDLDENQKFDTSVNERKFFLDTIKIIAYRAETALCNIIKKQMANPQEARSLIRRLYSADADIETDLINNILTVKIHNTNSWADDKILQILCNNLNETQTVFPDTNLTILFKLVTS